MDTNFDEAGREVLVEIVKMAQKKGMIGKMGTWKEFLSVYDKKFGTSMSDPSRRTSEVLLDFIKTFEDQNDLQFFSKVMQCQLGRNDVEKIKKKSAESESPEQSLVRMTIEHPLYPSCYVFPSYEEGWLITKRSKKSKSLKSTSMIAVDCEMVLCEDGSEAVVKVCVVDRNLEVKLNELVKPNKAVADYRSSITGVSAADLEGATCSLMYIQKSIKNLLRYGTILVGHSLNNDLQALKIDHGRVIDTSFVFKYGNGSTLRRHSLSDLCKSVLGYELREKGKPHNCLDDARAAMKLALAKIKGSDENLTLPALNKDVREVDLKKLLIHNISSSMPMEELHNIVPGDFTMETGDKKAGGSKYKVVALFKNEEEANQAFKDVQGNEEKDNLGRPQKLVSFKLATGASSNLYVRKMGDGTQISSQKRPHEDEEDNLSVKSKKSKMETESNECDNHLKEIERLKQELKERDQEISSLNKIIAALARKQGL